MITLSVINARVRRQKIAEQAGDQFVPRDEITNRIRNLQKFPLHQFLFGIFDNNDKWTAISVRSIIGCYDGDISELKIQNEADKFHDFFGQSGGKEKSDVFLTDGRRFWMKSVGISCSFQNIILMLQNLPNDIVLDE